MKKLRWQIIIVVIALIAIAVLLISQQPTILPGVEQEPEPVSGGLYSEAIVGEFGRLNPLLDYNNPADKDIDRLLYSSLIRFDDRGVPWGDLADTWGISQEGNVYNLSIRPEAVWHDGEPLTSEDIVFTVEAMLMDGMPTPDNLRSLWEQVEVIALNENTVQFRLPEPFAPFLDYLTFGVIPKHILDGLSAEQIIDSPFNLSPVGSGPYRFVKYVPNHFMELEANPDYFLGRPRIEKVQLKFVGGAGLAEALSGNIDILYPSDPADWPLLDRTGLFRIHYGVYPPAMVGLYLNHHHPLFSDSRVRRAIAHALDRPTLQETLGLPRELTLADVFIGAITDEDGYISQPISEEMVMTMKQGAVLVDISIYQGGCAETSRPTTIADPVFTKHGVIHYCVPNMPSVVARSSTYALTNGLVPYLLDIQKNGLKNTIEQKSNTCCAVITHNGSPTHSILEEMYGMEVTPLGK